MWNLKTKQKRNRTINTEEKLIVIKKGGEQRDENKNNIIKKKQMNKEKQVEGAADFFFAFCHGFLTQSLADVVAVAKLYLLVHFPQWLIILDALVVWQTLK